MGEVLSQGPIVFVINPRSAAGATLKRFERSRASFERALGALDVRLTDGPRHATELVRIALREGARTIVSVGGDGTNNEVVNGFFDDDGRALSPEACLAFYVSGTGGDFRRTLSWGTEPEEALARLVAGRTQVVDVGRVTLRAHDGSTIARMFLNIASFGLSGAVDEVVNRSSKALGAKASFMLGAVRAFAAYTPQRVRLTVDDRSEEHEILLVAVANGQYFGGGMKIAPAAVLDDQRFDVVTVGGISTLRWVTTSPKVYTGAHIGQEGVHVTRAVRVVAEPVDKNERVLIDLDGEQPGILPATFELRAASLRIVA